MRVKIESTGGFAGRDVMVAQYDTDELTAAQADRIHRAVDELAGSKERGEPDEIGADLPAYRITVGGPDDPDARVFEVKGDPGEALNAPLNALLQGP
ncbi:hypothetical protein J4573_33910 [Actinomadura barringtoniae]|uniref:Uncharacterized protein n=1 Tax=Actinomadura barringtoniae TaxID=1427535 RepID=A0A939PGA9_9ACTN|nr:protealysin inhibitor emfourin [Actinomadura barringtoniae]MBO2452126.1 hypothetical protein [Actinomadura barringtoniae]